MWKLATTVAVGLSLAGCVQEAGHELDYGSFGNANNNNQLVMRGELDYAVSLGNRFATEVPTTVNFAFDSAVIDAEAARALDQQANWIRQFPEVRFRVYGHTDKVGSNGYNYGLGKRRANAVVAYLASRGISRSRLEALVSYGETRPVIDTADRERRNRRTVTEVSGFVRRHPTVLDGKYAQIIYREYVASAVPPSGLTGRQGSGGFAQTQ
ncbi:OmpA family protein [Seohaeicola zhoushanensis]|uniref:Membrane protein n=1 Tax=Seohaeicola zhoushanensis TaxID=1569283 RepID=A0A8J3GW89_9RHOB|nr:OmpA family protein [Seohaeicola zhoushanensis]GHF42521.1 membrane protein [Seohaeicola zhoushanensis]